MIAPRTILPASSTVLERTVDTTFPRDWAPMADAAEPLATAGHSGMLPWVVQQWQITHLAPYFDSLDALLAAGRLWLVERGTTAGVLRVLQWLGYEHAQLEEDGFLLHIDLGRIATAAELDSLRTVVLATLPVHMRFYRVYFENDERPVRLDHGPALDVGLLDNDSGEWVGMDGDDIKASFGDVRSAVADRPTLQPVARGFTEVHSGVLTYDDRALLDTWHLDSHILLDAYGGLTELFMGSTTAPVLGVPVRSDAELRSSTATAWHADPVSSGGIAVHTGTTTVPIFAKRYWTGPWAGRWRESIPLIRSEEP